MKTQKYILLLVLSIFVFTTSFAQKQKTKPINSGFVFIDGKYIEPPYVIKRKENTVQINNQVIKFAS